MRKLVTIHGLSYEINRMGIYIQWDDQLEHWFCFLLNTSVSPGLTCFYPKVATIPPHLREFKELLGAAGNRLVVVEFSAQWCGPCKMIAPAFQAMSLQYRNVMFAQVDVDSSQELTEHCSIQVVPTFQMFKHSRKVTPFSRLKRILCCFRSGPGSKKIFEFQGADIEKLEEKIQELM
eukprot:XP_017448964.1 PREDICTED: thioredoxin domain-containing protein 8 isoform X1 [Rattus norvegicus]